HRQKCQKASGGGIRGGDIEDHGGDAGNRVTVVVDDPDLVDGPAVERTDGRIARIDEAIRGYTGEASSSHAVGGVGEPAADIGNHLHIACGVVEADQASATQLHDHTVRHSLAGREVQVGGRGPLC